MSVTESKTHSHVVVVGEQVANRRGCAARRGGIRRCVPATVMAPDDFRTADPRTASRTENTDGRTG